MTEDWTKKWLTEEERLNPDDCECGHPRVRHGGSGKQRCYEWLGASRCRCRSLALVGAASREQLQASLAASRALVAAIREQAYYGFTDETIQNMTEGMSAQEMNQWWQKRIL